MYWRCMLPPVFKFLWCSYCSRCIQFLIPQGQILTLYFNYFIINCPPLQSTANISTGLHLTVTIKWLFRFCLRQVLVKGILWWSHVATLFTMFWPLTHLLSKLTFNPWCFFRDWILLFLNQSLFWFYLFFLSPLQACSSTLMFHCGAHPPRQFI